MRSGNLILFTIPALIWGSTWFVITFQLGVVDPVLSVSYRFLLAGALLLVYCILFKLDLRFPPRQHFFMALQGGLLFGTNYWLVYLAELHLTSGLVAVVFSTLIFMNIFFSAILLKNPVRKQVIIGALFGVTGTILIFRPEVSAFDLEDSSFLGLIYCISGVLFASLGNITSAFNQRQKMPVIQTNAFGMVYGGLLMLTIGIISGKPLEFDFSYPYLLSLCYLSIFGSIIAFSTYLTLIGRIGPDKAAYVIVSLPAIALVISTVFENYQASYYAGGGILSILIGNFLAVRK